MKRSLDFVAALTGLVIASPVLMLVAATIWAHDRHSPFYRSQRAARGGGTFTMVKLRSMHVNADRIAVNSTAGDDPRITPVGRIVRTYKIDEIVQLWNVLTGAMSLVGPRPQVMADAARYTELEKRMLTVRPGLTDLASIVFADEGEVLRGSPEPDGLYDRIIRPWKSRLALLYVENQSLVVDFAILFLTIISLFARSVALRGVGRILRHWGAEDILVRMASRREQLLPYPPPGATAAAAM